MKNYYSVPTGYLEDPFNSVKLDPNGEYLADDNELRQLWDYAYDLSETLSKEFNLNAIASDLKSKFLGFVEIGLLAFKVKSYTLWKQDKRLKGFKDFCIKILGRSTWQVNDLIKGSSVMMKLIGLGFKVNELPRSLSQALELSKVSDNELNEIWKTCLSKHPIHQISAEKIKDVVNPEGGSKGSIKLPKSLLERLRDKARENGMTVEDLLEDFLGDDDQIEEIPEDLEETWHEDLEDLVKDSDEDEIDTLLVHEDESEETFYCEACGDSIRSYARFEQHKKRCYGSWQ